MQFTDRQQRIIGIITAEKQASISQIKELLNENVSQVTLNRDLARLVSNGALVKAGKARAIRYSSAPSTTSIGLLNCAGRSGLSFLQEVTAKVVIKKKIQLSINPHYS